MIKNAMKGKAITPKKDRDDYALLSYGTAKKTAKKLDDAFKQVSLILTTGILTNLWTCKARP